MAEQPLNNRVPITNQDGTPTQYFIRLLQERGFTIDDKITAAQAQTLIDAWAAARDIFAGTGLSGGGNLSADVTINLDASLDDLNDVDFSTPPTSGDALTYDGTNWVPGAVAGGLDVQDEGSSVVNPATAINFIGSAVTVTDGGGGVADVTITGGSGSSSGGFFSGGTGEFGSVSTSLYATKGAYYVPNTNVKVSAIECVIDAAATSQAHYAQIATVNTSTGQIGTVLATSNTVNSSSTDPRYFTFEFSSPVDLISGTSYILLVTNASGTGTTTLRVYAADGAFFKLNAPGSSPVGGPQYNTIGVTASQTASAVAATGYAIWAVGDITDMNGEWKLLTSWDYSVDGSTSGVIGNVAGYTEALIEFVDVSTTSSGCRIVRVSTDGGSSYYSGASDYQYYTTAGVGNNQDSLYGHSTNSSAIRTASIQMFSLSVTGPSKTAFSLTQNVHQAFRANSSPITHIKAMNTAGDLSGGYVRIWVR